MPDHSFEILIDGQCPLCRTEAAFLQRLDRGRGRLKLTDISDPGFTAFAYGITQDDAMGTIHGVRENGQLVTGMDVFRDAYRAVGLGWLFAPTAWPGLRQIFDFGYRWFARNRLRLTGRGDEGGCTDDRCAVPGRKAAP